jgi:hypothetical protein
VPAAIARRLQFAGHACKFFDDLFSLWPLSQMALVGGNPLPRLGERLARIAYDAVDTLLGARVPAPLGAIEQALVAEGGPYAQHPHYRSYWYDKHRHSMVGLHLGLDIARYQNAYFVIELNIGAGMRAQRRALYPEALDPIISGAVGLAAELGFERFVPMAMNWPTSDLEEFSRAGQAAGIEVAPVRLPYWPGQPAHSLRSLPDPLEAKTFYWIHSGVMTPLIFYLHDKWSSSSWLSALPEEGLVRAVPTRDELTLFPNDAGPGWPNLVVKLNHSDRGEQVVLARFTDLQQAGKTLGAPSRGRAIPRVFRRSLLEAVRSRVFGGDWALYQPFLPSEPVEGRLQLIRLHLLVSPLGDRYLSAHSRLCHQPAPPECPPGIQPPRSPYMGSYPTTADYARVDTQWEQELVPVSQQLGSLIRRALEKKFILQ